eukprot:1821593-Rhodomonas_salina.2
MNEILAAVNGGRPAPHTLMSSWKADTVSFTCCATSSKSRGSSKYASFGRSEEAASWLCLPTATHHHPCQHNSINGTAFSAKHTQCGQTCGAGEVEHDVGIFPSVV